MQNVKRNVIIYYFLCKKLHLLHMHAINASYLNNIITFIYVFSSSFVLHNTALSPSTAPLWSIHRLEFWLCLPCLLKILMFGFILRWKMKGHNLQVSSSFALAYSLHISMQCSYMQTGIPLAALENHCRHFHCRKEKKYRYTEMEVK